MALRGTGDEFDRLAGTLNAMLDRIETLVRDLRTVTDSLAHDLRSPLGRLVRHLEAAADEEDRPGGAAGAGSSRRCARPRACSAPRRRSSTSRASRPGIGAEQFTDVELGRLAADVAELYEAAAEERGLTLACDAAPGPRGARPRPAAGAGAVEPGGQRAEARAGRAPRSPSPPGCDGGQPALIVGDRGPGIPEADRERALGRFVRLDPSRGSPGAGLGLALVAAVARMHGAAIELADNDPGLRATLRFPAPAGVDRS